jgi:hypothetical protein
MLEEKPHFQIELKKTGKWLSISNISEEKLIFYVFSKKKHKRLLY